MRGSLGDLATAAADGSIPARGEFVLIVGMGDAADAGSRSGDADAALDAARADVERLVSEGVARGDAARRVAAQTGLPRRRLYGLTDV